jgi:hypothetical protein
MRLIRKPQPNERKVSYWWPDIDSVFVAKTVVTRAAGAAAFQATLFTLVTTLAVLQVWNPFNLDGFAYADSLVYAACAYFMYYKQSRIAAVLVLMEYVAGFFVGFNEGGTYARPGFMTIVFVLAYINAIRASFMLKRLQKAEMADWRFTGTRY